MLHHGVHRDKCDAVRQLDKPVPQAAAIDLHRRMRLPEDRDVLVHDAARHADVIAFGALAELYQFELIEFAPIQKG